LWCALTPANLHDAEGAEDIPQGVTGYLYLLAERNDENPKLSQRLNTYGLYPSAPYKSVKRQRQPYLGYMTMHYPVETGFDQLVQRFHAKRTWARDLEHLTSRWMKIS
jgi:hypothetical protein